MANQEIERTARLALCVPRSHVKRVKSALEAQNLLEKSKKITPDDSSTNQEPRMLIYTTISCSDTETPTPSILPPTLDLEDTKHGISLTSYKITTTTCISNTNNPLLNGVRAGLQSLPQDLVQSLDLTIEALATSFPESYSIYKPMLLLPHNVFASASWSRLISSYPVVSYDLQPLWKTLAVSVGVTHIAINASIPPKKENEETSDISCGKDSSTRENTLRSPSNLVPVYGSFGPPPTPQTLTHPTPTDFASTLWVTHTQNGIHQVWAPLYTMFSRGNIREKTRLLTLPSVTSSVQDPHRCTAVDLYAGIGYFAFSYRKAGARKVLCWELNPWSVEGLRRGAKKNGWSTHIFDPSSLPSGRNDESKEWKEWGTHIHQIYTETDFFIFQQSNDDALPAIRALYNYSNTSPDLSFPPIRHINLGLLPTSLLSWRTAVNISNLELGSWIHVHENVGVFDIEERKGQIIEEMLGYVGQRERLDIEKKMVVKCEWVERVKTYAPGVIHVVFDIYIGPVV